VNMPGCTATNSLCAGSRKYSVPRTAPERSGLAVEPQLRAGSPARVEGTIGQGIGRVARRAAPVVGRVARLAAAILG
jgi:hypothetical protein